MSLNAKEIPPETLSEVIKVVAQRHETKPADLNREKIPEQEFMAALAYHLCVPIIDAGDLDEELISMCRQMSRELDLSGLAEYNFVPLVQRGTMILVVSSCPWEPTTIEVINGYFPRCTQVRFVMASPATLDELLKRIKGQATAPVSSVAGYAPRQVSQIRTPTPTIAPAKPAARPPAAPVAAPATGPTAKVPSAPAPSRTPTVIIQDENPAPHAQPETVTPPALSAPAVDLNQLSSEEVVYLVNVLVQEANRMLQKKRVRKP